MKRFAVSTPLDAPLLLFLLAALLGVWNAYNRAAAFATMVVLVAAVVVYFLLTFHVRQTPRARLVLPPRFMTGLVVGGVMTNVVWMVVFVAMPHSVNAHSLAGVTEISLPFAAALILSLAWRNEIPRALAMSLPLVVLIAGLVFAGAYSTLLCLALVGITAAVLALGSRIRFNGFICAPRMRAAFAATIVALAGIAYLNSAALASAIARIAPFFSQDDFPRGELYANVLYLIRDYAFTGSGLGTFPMVYAIYGQLLHVYYFPHAHNILLQVWMEQGLVGLLAWGWLIVAFYARMWRQRAQMNWLATGGVASVSVALLHGLWDAPLYYVGWTLVLMFAPMGMAIGAVPPVARSASQPRKRNAMISFAVFIAVGALLLLNCSAVGGMWFANMASLAQTRIELGAYQFPARAIPTVRRTMDETQARTLFETALQWDANNVTALQRLGMLAFARGEYAKAQTYLAHALTNAPDDWRTRQLLGDVYLAQGRAEEAFAFWSRVRDAPSKLEVEAALLYDRAGDAVRAARARELARRIRLQIKPK